MSTDTVTEKSSEQSTADAEARWKAREAKFSAALREPVRPDVVADLKVSLEQYAMVTSGTNETADVLARSLAGLIFDVGEGGVRISELYNAVVEMERDDRFVGFLSRADAGKLARLQKLELGIK